MERRRKEFSNHRRAFVTAKKVRLGVRKSGRKLVEKETRVDASRSGLQFPVGFIVEEPADEIGFLRSGRWSIGDS